MFSARLQQPRTWLLALVSAHLLLALYYFPPGEFFANPPIRIADYADHFYEAHAVDELLKSSGHSWGYDPHFMAGYPVGTVFDVDNKLVEAGVWALSSLGQPLAFNLLVAFFYVALPFVVLHTTLKLGLPAWSRVSAVALALLVWQFDPSIHAMEHVGMFAFVSVAYLAPWIVSLFHDYVRGATLRKWLWLTMATTLTLWLQPLAVLLLPIPIACLYAQRLKHLPRVAHLALYGTLMIALLVNLYWIIPLVQFRSILTETGLLFRGGLGALGNDLLEIGVAEGGGYPRVLIVRWMVVALAAVGLSNWLRSDRKNLGIAFGAGILWLLALAFLFADIPAVAALEPYRFVVPAVFLMIFPAASVVGESNWTSAFKSSAKPVRISLLVLLLIAVPSALRAFYYLHPRVERYWSADVAEDRFLGPGPRQRALMAWLRQNTTPEARILIQDWNTGALIPFFVDREVIGGPYEQYFIRHGFANVSSLKAFGQDVKTLNPDDLRAYLDAYNVQWIIVNPTALANREVFSFDDYFRRLKPGFVHFITTIREFSIYRVDTAPNFFLQGTGQVSASYNEIRVRHASAGRVVLKYHWLDQLKTNPPLKLERYPVLDDPVGFIEVDNGKCRRFVIYNGY